MRYFLMRRASSVIFACLLMLAAVPLATAQTISTVVGTGIASSTGDNALAVSATLNLPYGVAVDLAGNLYIAERSGHRIRRVDGVTGIITTIVGTGISGFGGDGGPGNAAQINAPNEVIVANNGDLYFADTGNHRVRKVDAATQTITTLAGDGSVGSGGDNGPATAAQLDSPYGIAILANGDILISDQNTHRIRRVVAASGDIVPFAGTGVVGFSGDGGPALTAQFRAPRSLALDVGGNVYVADTDNQRIRLINAGVVTTVAGNGTAGAGGDGGPATLAQLNFVHGLAIHPNGSLYIADSINNRIRTVAGNGIITTYAGTGAVGSTGDGGAATNALLNVPYGMSFDRNGVLFFADRSNHKIRRIAPAGSGSIIANGSFESQILLQNTVLTNGATTLTGWTIGGTGAVSHITGPLSGISPTNGSQMLAFNLGGASAGGTISQTFATTPGQLYFVDFKVAQTLAVPPATGFVGIRAVVTSSTGQTNGVITWAAPPGGPWSFSPPLGVFPFLATTPTSTLSFIDTSLTTAGVDLLLDSVSVIAAQAGANTTNTIVYDLIARMDGSQDTLIFQDATLQWNHISNGAGAPGRSLGLNVPTTISSSLNGVQVMNMVDWIPTWPLPVPNNIRFDAVSSFGLIRRSARDADASYSSGALLNFL